MRAGVPWTRPGARGAWRFTGLLAALLAAWLAGGCGGGGVEAGGDAPHADEHEAEAGHAEGVVELAREAVRRGRIQVGRAGPAEVAVTVEAPGEVKLDAERVVEVRPRFPGVVRELRKRLGDSVRPGEVLAVIHGNESLADYEVAASMPGTVVARQAAEGQAVDHESVLYTVADLSTVWVDFAIYPQHMGVIRRGQPVRVVAQGGSVPPARGTVSYVGPLLEQDTRVSYGRVVLPGGGRWQPGLFVTAAVTVDRARVPVAVPEEAIVRTAEGPAVFLAEGSTFRLQPVAAGRSDGVMTEIVEGLRAGAAVVVKNAFLLKAELGKSEVHHEH